MPTGDGPRDPRSARTRRDAPNDGDERRKAGDERSTAVADRATVGVGTESATGSLAPGDVLAGRYEVISELGRGAEGVVLEARDLRAGAVIALKLIPEAEVTGARLARLRRELALARRITHPSVVRTYDLVDVAGWVGLTMELVRGKTLRVHLNDTPVADRSVAWLAQLAEHLAEALAAAHTAGVVHRDLKPSNVLLGMPDGPQRGDRSRAKITDFGIARVSAEAPASARFADSGSADAAAFATAVGSIVGTPRYMAPEQLDGSPDVGPAADVYALGLLLFEAATDERPLDGADLASLREARRGRAPKLGERRPDLPIAFAAIVDRCLEPAVADRFVDGAAVLDALRKVAAHPEIPTTPDTTEPRPIRRSRRLLGGLGVALVIGAGSVAAWSVTRERVRSDASSSARVDPNVIQFDKRGFAVGEKRSLHEISTRSLTFVKPSPLVLTTTDEVQRSVTVMSADRYTLLKVRIEYQVATHTEDRGGVVTRKELPIQGKAYIVEVRDGRPVVSDTRYEPVLTEEADLVLRAAGPLGTPSREITTLPDVPVRVGDRADSLAELFSAALLQKGEIEMDQVEVTLGAIDRSSTPTARFDVKLVGRSKSADPHVELDIGGELEVMETGRIRLVDLSGKMALSGEELEATGTYSMRVVRDAG
ncbi:MAG: serine/threonine-protein kinase [Polyangiaceae bacterium]